MKTIMNDIKILIDYINNTLLKEYPSSDNNIIYYITGILENENTIANEILSKNLMTSQIMELKDICYEILEENKQSANTIPLINIENEIKQLLSKYDEKLNTGYLLQYLFENDSFTINLFKKYGVSLKQISSCLKNENKKNENNDVPKKHTRKKSSEIKNKTSIKETDNEVEKYLINLNKLSDKNGIPLIKGNEKLINNIFKTFLKKDNNNVILVGEHGVGKTSTIRNIANLILNNSVPKQFEKKVLMEMDFQKILSGTAIRGTFENRITNIVSDAKISNKYIFFIDEIEYMLETRNYGDKSIEMFLETILSESNINVIITTSPKGYSNFISDYPALSRKITKLELKEPNNEECLKILNDIKEKYEIYHTVSYTKEALETCIDLSKRFLSDIKLPSSAIDVLDETGANIRINEKPTDKITELKNKLIDIQNEKSFIINENSHKNADKIDELTKKEINIKSLLNIEEKNNEINKQPYVITTDHIRECISQKSGIPLSKINEDDKSNLKTLNNKLKNVVIGQDNAVEEVCKVVKRQRLGLSNQNKPAVLMFTGSTGTGKTYLAKKLSEYVFGDEKYMVRLDMSEYSDKMAASKLIGSSAGYIGYDNGGILTEAIKKNKYCVLLLDECEKADETVFNMLLQVFDDGHLTDNKGIKVDFKNVIIIMTSNIGAQEASERNGGIGFNTKDNINNFEKSIYERAIKRHFKPEFINRIDKLIFFNRLTEENLKDIIKLEIEKINKRLQKIDFSIDENSYDDIINEVIEKIGNKNEYGARPIMRELQTVLEDKITDMIIENDLEKGHIFTYKELNEF